MNIPSMPQAPKAENHWVRKQTFYNMMEDIFE
jgi:hypothetical protein